MSRTVRIKEPSPEMMLKIREARNAIAKQKTRVLKCPYCQHHAIVVFEDTKGHVQTKCKSCKQEIVFDVLSMRRMFSAY